MVKAFGDLLPVHVQAQIVAHSFSWAPQCQQIFSHRFPHGILNPQACVVWTLQRTGGDYTAAYNWLAQHHGYLRPPASRLHPHVRLLYCTWRTT
jgi:hypothetical protein